MVNEVIKNNPRLLDKYPILEMEFNKDGTKKKFYSLASEKDIKETQIKSDENELEFNYSQNKITKEDYELQKLKLKTKLEDQNYIYDTLIFDSIKYEDMESLKQEIITANLDEVELKRLASSLSSIAEEKINDFHDNNKEFKITNISYWNRKYDMIAKNYAKTRELEGFILGLIE
ncbi:MAG: hypothetical protein J6O56_03685 [Bacilli bacterium]|nr:hypothetical protein [Bacilli bacterium]